MRLPIIVLALAAISCHGQTYNKTVKPPAEHFPWYVRNPCTGQWAVRTQRIPEQITVFAEYYYFGHAGDWHRLLADSNYAVLGYEFTFPDSLSAVRAYTAWPNSLIHAAEIRAKWEAEERRKDSIFDCQHSYQ